MLPCHLVREHLPPFRSSSKLRVWGKATKVDAWNLEATGSSVTLVLEGTMRHSRYLDKGVGSMQPSHTRIDHVTDRFRV